MNGCAEPFSCSSFFLFLPFFSFSSFFFPFFFFSFFVFFAATLGSLSLLLLDVDADEALELDDDLKFMVSYCAMQG